MAYPPKGFDRDEIERLRKVQYEKTGDWAIRSPEALRERPVIYGPEGNPRFKADGTPYRGYNPVFDSSGELVTYNDLPKSAGGRLVEANGAEPEFLTMAPAQLSEIPTSSTDASRPRTVAAGYTLEAGQQNLPLNMKVGRVTVMFRDGTLYNYYNVPHGTWIAFRGSLSKGPYVNRANKNQGSDGPLLAYPHGPADVSEIPEELRFQLLKVARGAQVRYKTTNRARGGYNEPDKRRKVSSRTPKEYVPKSAARKAGMNPNSNKGRARKPSNPASRP